MYRKHNILAWYCTIYDASTRNKEESERPEKQWIIKTQSAC
jgi:hypothetical protein